MSTPGKRRGTSLNFSSISRLTEIDVAWDVSACAASEYNLIHGDLGSLSDLTILGGQCAIGIAGSFTWSGVPAGDLFFLLVGVDATGVYESSWGRDSTGTERRGTEPSNVCGVTTKDVVEVCP